MFDDGFFSKGNAIMMIIFGGVGTVLHPFLPKYFADGSVHTFNLIIGFSPILLILGIIVLGVVSLIQLAENEGDLKQKEKVIGND